MILLSFTTAAKYVLSMMLAVLGIISYEDIEVPPIKAETAELTFMNMERPLKLNDSNTFSGEAFFTSSIGDISNPRFIPNRNNFDFNEYFSKDLEVYEFVHCTITTENLKDVKEFNQIIILCKELETEVEKETVYLLNANI